MTQKENLEALFVGLSRLSALKVREGQIESGELDMKAAILVAEIGCAIDKELEAVLRAFNALVLTDADIQVVEGAD